MTLVRSLVDSDPTPTKMISQSTKEQGRRDPREEEEVSACFLRILQHVERFLKCLELIRALEIQSFSPSSVPNSVMVILLQEGKFFPTYKFFAVSILGFLRRKYSLFRASVRHAAAGQEIGLHGYLQPSQRWALYQQLYG